jgi:hypothetical protein
MAESVIDIRDRLRARRPTVRTRPTGPAVVSVPAVQNPPAFAVENKDTNRVIVSTPFDAETAGTVSAGDFILNLTGRLVEAEHANRNGAFWTQGDLEFGLPSVGRGPLNWLHEETKIVGSLFDPVLVNAREAAAGSPSMGPHIRTEATMWGWIFPREVAAVQDYATAGKAWLSMECISQEVACVGPNGCGSKVSYLDYQHKADNVCAHLRERASHRRFVNPIFQGAAVIVPPVEPGWANADLGLKLSLDSQRQAASIVEGQTSSGNLTIAGIDDDVAHNMIAQIMQWSARSTS